MAVGERVPETAARQVLQSQWRVESSRKQGAKIHAAELTSPQLGDLGEGRRAREVLFGVARRQSG